MGGVTVRDVDVSANHASKFPHKHRKIPYPHAYTSSTQIENLRSKIAIYHNMEDFADIMVLFRRKNSS